MVWPFDFSSNVTFMVVLHDWEKSPSGVLRGVSFTGDVCVCGRGGGGVQSFIPFMLLTDVNMTLVSYQP